MNSEQPDKITHNELIELGRKWLIKPYNSAADYGHSGCSVILTEICAVPRSGEQPDVLGFCSDKSILIECKASRADFLADKNKPFRVAPEMGVGCQRWYMAPQGLIKENEVPPKWGLLEVTHGRRITPSKKPEPQEKSWRNEMVMIVSMLRRLNINPDGHIAIKRYDPPEQLGFKPSKNRATFYVGGQA